MTARGLGAVALAAVLAVVTALVLLGGGEPLGVDRTLSDGAAGGGTAEWLTQVGSGAVLYPVLLWVALTRWRRTRDPWMAGLPVLALVVAQVLEAVAFVTVDRPGPTGAMISFSSGHSMAAVLGWGLVAREIGRRPATVAAALLAVVAGWTRVELGAHWASDVLVGWLLGGLALLVADHILRSTSAESVSPPRPAAPGAVRSNWMWLTTAVGAAVALMPLLLVSGPGRMKDLLVYFGAGSSAGGGRDVYDFRTVYDMPFTYPPFAALLSEPLSRIPLGLLQTLWAIATVAALVVVARVAMAPIVARIGLPLTLALLFVSSPVRSHLRFGQVGVFLVLLVSWDLLRDHGRQGIGLGVAVAVKLTPAVFLPWLLVVRRPRVLVRAVATAVAATLAGLALLWPSAQEYLWRALWDSSRFGPNDIPGNQSVRGMLLRTGLSDDAAAAIWLAVALALVVVGTLNARRLEVAGQRLGAVGVLAALSVAVSPISWVHHLVFLVLPLSALVAAGRHRLAGIWASALIASLPSLGVAGLEAGFGPNAFWQMVINAQGLTAVLAVLLLPRLLVRSHGSAAPTYRVEVRG